MEDTGSRRGYWQRLKSGKRVHQDRLPEWSHPWLREPVEFQSMVRTAEEERKDNETSKLIESERDPANQIVVVDSLAEVHPLVAKTRDVLTTAKSSDRGILQTGKQTCLDLQVSLDSLKRALVVMDALIKALERRGFTVSVVEGEAKTRVTVLGETIDIGVEERVDRKDRRKDAKTYTYPWYEFVPSGVLSLRIRQPSWITRTTWSDGKKQRIERVLNQCVVAITEASLEVREHRLECEASERRLKEEERKAAERERQRRREERRLRALFVETLCWSQSQQMRSYIEAVKETATRMHGAVPEGGTIDKWITWATRRANRLDPLGEGARAPRERKSKLYAPIPEKGEALRDADIVWNRLPHTVRPKEDAW